MCSGFVLRTFEVVGDFLIFWGTHHHVDEVGVVQDTKSQVCRTTIYYLVLWFSSLIIAELLNYCTLFYLKKIRKQSSYVRSYVTLRERLTQGAVRGGHT